MIRRVEALNYRCLRDIDQRLNSLNVLVGPNASGKTTLLDVVVFLRDLVESDMEHAVGERTKDLRDLLWWGQGDRFELAIELEIPAERRQTLGKPSFNAVRYEVAVGFESDQGTLSILEEKVLLKPQVDTRRSQQRTLFPIEPEHPLTIMTPRASKGAKTIVNKVSGGNDNFYDETGKGWDHAFKLGPLKSALRNLPEDETKFPVSTWLKRILQDGVQKIVLNSATMRKPSPPGQPLRFRPDGSNLPWVVADLREKHPQRHGEWVEHLRMALPDLADVKTRERPEDRHRYLILCYQGGLEIPSWTASDGTLRLLALTLPAYLVGLEGVYLIEEPENGIHPRAVENMFQSLSSVYDAQILMATHSPVVLNIAERGQILCFSKTESGSVDIVSGSEHPGLKDWRGEAKLGVLFAGGVLG